MYFIKISEKKNWDGSNKQKGFLLHDYTFAQDVIFTRRHFAKKVNFVSLYENKKN